MTDLENLPSLEEIAVNARPVELTNAVYFLFDRGELVYIGKASNVHERIGQNLRDKQFDAYAYIHVEPARALLIEAAYIQKYLPKYNKQVPGRIVINGDPSRPKPLRLKWIMMDFGITQLQMACGISQSAGRVAGKNLSVTAVAQIVNWDIWPSMTSREEIMRQAENYLRFRGVPENRLRSLWRRANHPMSSNGPDEVAEMNGGVLCAEQMEIMA